MQEYTVEVAKGRVSRKSTLSLKKNVMGEIGDWHHKGPGIAWAATRCQTRFGLRR